MKKQLPAALALLLLALAAAATPQASQCDAEAGPHSTELRKLFNEDQAERTSGNVDWDLVDAHDKVRRERVAQLINAGGLHTGDDYFHACLIFQHGDAPQDHLLAHVLCTTALAKGATRARWLTTATLDAYLLSIGQAQLYGTQFPSAAGQAPRLGPIAPDFPDSLRREMNAPSLEEARAKEARLVREYEARQRAEPAEKVPRTDMK